MNSNTLRHCRCQPGPNLRLHNHISSQQQHHQPSIVPLRHRTCFIAYISNCRYCGNITERFAVVAMGEVMIVNFLSDYTNVYRGFFATFSSGINLVNILNHYSCEMSNIYIYIYIVCKKVLIIYIFYHYHYHYHILYYRLNVT